MNRLLLHHPASSTLLTGLESRFHPGLLPVVPNVQAGRDLRQSLRGAGRALTLTQWAREALQEAGWTPLRPGEREAFFREALAHVPFEYLGPLLERPGTLTRLEKLVGELLRDHLDPAALLEVAGDARQRDVAAAYAAYLTHARAGRRFDRTGTEYFASALPSLRPRAAAVHGFVYFDASQVAFLARALAGGSLVTLPHEPGVQALRRTEETFRALQSAGFQPEAVSGLPKRHGDRLVQAYLARTPVPRGVMKAEFAEIEAEVRACLKQVRAWLADGSRPENVAVVVRHEASYLPTLADIAWEYALPLVSGLQVPLLETALGGVVQAWVDAHARDWLYSAVRRLLTLPLLRPPFDALRQARTLRPACPPGLDAWGDLGWLALPPQTTWQAGLNTLERLLTGFGVRDRCRADPALNVALRTLVDRLAVEARREESCSREEVLGLVAHVLRTATVPALLGRSGVRPAQIVAVTFTEAAAAELRERVTAVVERRAEEEGGPWPGLVTDLALMQVGTIHSLCGRVAREHPVESGAGLSFTVLDELEARVWLEEHLSPVLAEVQESELETLLAVPGRIRREVLEALLDDPSSAREALRVAVAARELDPVERAGRAWDTALPQWQAAVTALECVGSPAGDVLEEMRLGVLRLGRDAPLYGDDLLTVREVLRDHSGKIGKGWTAPAKKQVNTALELIKALAGRDDLAGIAGEATAAHDRAVLALERLFDHVTRRFAVLKAGAEIATFADLETFADAALVHDHVRAYYARRRTHLLIDEAQDTNPVQWRILSALAGKDVNLTVVGDEKQSIYAFRRADVQVFRDARDEVEARAGEVIRMDTSFRTHAALVDTINAFFASLMAGPDGARPTAARFEPLSAHRIPSPLVSYAPPQGRAFRAAQASRT